MRIHIHLPVVDPDPVRFDLFGVRWRRLSVVRIILVAMPGTSDASIDDLPFAQRSVLVPANIAYGGNLLIVLKDGDGFISTVDDPGALIRNAVHGTDVDPVGFGPGILHFFMVILSGGSQVQND